MNFVVNVSADEFYNELSERIRNDYGVAASSATTQHVYNVVCELVRRILGKMRSDASNQAAKEGKKEVYYLSMEFLIGKSLRNNLSNLGIEEVVKEAVERCGVTLEIGRAHV